MSDESEESESEESDESEIFEVPRTDANRQEAAGESESLEEHEEEEPNEEQEEEEQVEEQDDEEETSGEDTPEPVPLRRSGRVRRPPAKFRSGDYVTNFQGNVTTGGVNQQDKLIILSRLLDLLK